MYARQLYKSVNEYNALDGLENLSALDQSSQSACFLYQYTDDITKGWIKIRTEEELN
jgi:hypothetical protein